MIANIAVLVAWLADIVVIFQLFYESVAERAGLLTLVARRHALVDDVFQHEFVIGVQ